MNEKVKKVYRRIYYYGAWVFSKLFLLVPYKLTINYAARFFGYIAYIVAVDARKIAIKNLTDCFPEKSQKEIRRIAKNVFVNETRNFFELANFPKMDAAFIKKISSIQNPHLIQEGIRKGKGVLFVSAHTGNWEITAAAVANFGVPVNVVAKKIYIDGLNDMLVDYRIKKNVKVILRDAPDTARKLLRALKNGEIIAMLIDQDTTVPSIFVDFFGRPAWTPSGLAVMALRTGAEVLVGIDQRVGKYNHKTVVSGPITITPTGNKEEDIVNLTQKASLVLEKHIKEFPDQWVWFHERWKTKNNE